MQAEPIAGPEPVEPYEHVIANRVAATPGPKGGADVLIEERIEGRLMVASRDGKPLAYARRNPAGSIRAPLRVTLANGRTVGLVAGVARPSWRVELPNGRTIENAVAWGKARMTLRWAARYFEGLVARGIA